MRLPENYIREMKELLGSEYPAYEASLSDPVCSGLRINRLKVSLPDWDPICPFVLEPVPWTENGFYYGEEDSPSRHPYYYAGLYYLQEPSAMTPASRLPVFPGERVLDLCAAPGGKATELGAKLEGKGLLWANDISNSRTKALLKNLELAGIGNCCVTSESPARLAEELPEYFDKILVDAPCSGEGMFHREPSMVSYWEERGPKDYVPVQRELLAQAASMLKPGGMLLYSTCTFSVKENEENIRWILEKEKSLKMAKLQGWDGFAPGRLGLSGCVRIFPHKMKGEGHFLALLEKEGGKAEVKTADRTFRTKIPEEALTFLSEIKRPDLRERLFLKKNRLYQIPEGISLPEGLRYLRTGLYLGEQKKNRFEPSQALAMNLKKKEYEKCLDFPPGDARVFRYLKGETVQVQEQTKAGDKGWYLVCVSGYPLGWGKLDRGMLKNKYCPGWRMQ